MNWDLLNIIQTIQTLISIVYVKLKPIQYSTIAVDVENTTCSLLRRNTIGGNYEYITKPIN